MLGICAIGGSLVAALGAVRPGGILIAAGFVLAALVRALADERASGGLHIRSRALDVATFLLVAVAVLASTFGVALVGRT